MNDLRPAARLPILLVGMQALAGGVLAGLARLAWDVSAGAAAAGTLEAEAGRSLFVEAPRVMVCGNPEMTREIRQILAARGFASSRRGANGQMAFENYWSVA